MGTHVKLFKEMSRVTWNHTLSQASSCTPCFNSSVTMSLDPVDTANMRAVSPCMPLRFGSAPGSRTRTASTCLLAHAHIRGVRQNLSTVFDKLGSENIHYTLCYLLNK